MNQDSQVNNNNSQANNTADEEELRVNHVLSSELGMVSTGRRNANGPIPRNHPEKKKFLNDIDSSKYNVTATEATTTKDDDVKANGEPIALVNHPSCDCGENFDPLAGIEPLPPRMTARNRRIPSQPGAISVGRAGAHPPTQRQEQHQQQQQQDTHTLPTENSSFSSSVVGERILSSEPVLLADISDERGRCNGPVAKLVGDEEENLQQAIPQEEINQNNAAASSSSRKRPGESNKKTKTSFLLAAAAAAVAILLVIVIITVSSTKKDTKKNAEEASNLSTIAPTSLEEFILSLFPEETRSAIITEEEHEEETPQSKAWKWLLEDRDALLYHHSKDRIRQRLALATLYYSTTGGDDDLDHQVWTNDTHWLDHAVHECEWFTQTDFARKKFISTLYQGSTYLSGFLEPLPETYCNEEGLYQHLWLDKNNLVGQLPRELYLLTSLQTLSLGYNSLEGTISTYIGRLAELEGLYFAGNKNLEGDLPSQLGLLTKLQFLGGWDNNFGGTLPQELWQLTNLFHLGLGSNAQLRGTIPSNIASFQKMRWLMLGRSNLSGTIPSEIGKLTSLEKIGISASQMSGTLPTQIGLLQEMEQFDLSGNSLTGALPTELGQMTASTMLRLGENQFSGTVPSECGGLTELTITLNLRDNSLTGTIPTELGLLSRAYELELRGNRLTGPIPSQLGQLSFVSQLTFASNRLSGSVPPEVCDLHSSLHTLMLEGNPLLSGTIPDSVCNVTGTCVATPFDSKRCSKEQGLSFDCTGLLCGCGCSCESNDGERA